MTKPEMKKEFKTERWSVGALKNWMLNVQRIFNTQRPSFVALRSI